MADTNNRTAVDSNLDTAAIAEGGNFRYYLKQMMANPGRVTAGIRDSLEEVFRFCFKPRFDLKMSTSERVDLVRRFILAEANIPGATTLFETLWLVYIASQAPLKKETWVEIGCFKGLSSARLSLVCNYYGSKFRIYDTFCGLPTSDDAYDTVEGERLCKFTAGSYAGSLDEVKTNIQRYGAGQIVSFHQGDVKESLKNGIDTTVGFAFLDVDLVESYKTCFQGLANGIKPGSTICMHEALYKNIRELIEDSAFWASMNLAQPQICYMNEKYKQQFLRNLAVLTW